MPKSTTAAITIFTLTLTLSAQRQPEPPAPIIRAGSRLVEVDVVVRDKDGPVTGLTRDDFTLLDQGKRQKIAEFSVGANSSGTVAAGWQPAVPLPGGTTSNRTDRSGHATAGATVLMFDLLNTSLDNQAYARGELLKALETADIGEQIAIYLLGRNLTLVQDFTANRETAKQAVRKWDPKDLFVLVQNTENMDAIDRQMQCGAICQELRTQTTTQAIAKIAQNLAGMPGRKSLVWVSDKPGSAGLQVLSAANIHIYPVLARSVGTSGVAGWVRDTREAGPAGMTAPQAMASGTEIERQRANAGLAAANGGVGFADSRDISKAVRTAIEDAGNTYILGFYASEETLDNKFHPLNVEVGKKGAARGRTLDIQCRPGYLSARAAPPAAAIASSVPAANDRPTLDQLLRNPLDASQLKLTADPAPDPARPDSLLIKVHVDPHGLAREHQNARQSIGLNISFHIDESARVLTKTLKFQIPDDQFDAFLEKGIDTVESIDTTGGGAVLRVVVQDPVTGAAGSVTLPLAKK